MKIMDKFAYKNTRFDPELVAFYSVPAKMAASVGYTADLEIDPALAQLLRLRVAQMNPCSFCQILHTQAAYDRDIHPAKVAHLSSWRDILVPNPLPKSLRWCAIW